MQVSAKRLAPLGCQRIPAYRLARDEFFLYGDILRVLKFSQLRAQVAVGLAEQFFQPREAQRVGRAQKHARAEPAAMLEKRIKCLQAAARLLMLIRLLKHGFRRAD